MPTSLFVNLPVDDLEKTMAFFGGLGYEFNPQFTNELAACMLIEENIFAMLLTKPHFESFIDRPISNAHESKEVLLALMLDSPQAVRDLCEKAFELGARRYKEPEDMGFMFSWGYEDLDGHIWELGWMDPNFVMPTES